MAAIEPNGIDAFLNFIIPIAIFVVLGFLIWRGFKDDIRGFLTWCKETFGEKIKHQKDDSPYGTNYQIEYR